MVVCMEWRIPTPTPVYYNPYEKYTPQKAPLVSGKPPRGQLRALRFWGLTCFGFGAQAQGFLGLRV